MKSEIKELEKSKKEDIENIFQNKIEKLSINANLDLEFIREFPIVGEYVYGEAFPEKNLVKLEVFAPYVEEKEIEKTICHELIHIQKPELSHNSRKFEKEVKPCIGNPS